MRNYERTIYHRGYELQVKKSFSSKGFPSFDLIVIKDGRIIKKKVVHRNYINFVGRDRCLKMFIDGCIVQDKKS